MFANISTSKLLGPQRVSRKERRARVRKTVKDAGNWDANKTCALKFGWMEILSEREEL